MSNKTYNYPRKQYVKSLIFISNQVCFKYKGYGETVLNMQELTKYCPNTFFEEITRGQTSINERTDNTWEKGLAVLESSEDF